MLFRKVKQKLTPYFSFTASERRGVFILLIVFGVLLGIRILLPHINNDEDSAIITVVGNYSIANPVESNEKYKNEKLAEGPSDTEIKVLNINNASFENLIKCGFTKFSATNIIKYRNEGGVFYSKSNLLKIYGLDKESLMKIEETTKIEYITKAIQTDTESGYSNLKTIEINSADTSILMSLNGIGPVLGKRIIKYREALGGFYSKDQLLEVYGINDELFVKINSNIRVDSTKVQKLNINSADEGKLKTHPYISNYQAKTIIQYRTTVGEFKNLKELLINNIFGKDEYLKASRYLTTR